MVVVFCRQHRMADVRQDCSIAQSILIERFGKPIRDLFRIRKVTQIAKNINDNNGIVIANEKLVDL